MTSRMLERERDQPRARAPAVMPHAHKQQTLYHPLEVMSRCAESMRRPAESTHATSAEADRNWGISSRVSEVSPQAGRPLHGRFLELVKSIQ